MINSRDRIVFQFTIQSPKVLSKTLVILELVPKGSALLGLPSPYL